MELILPAMDRVEKGKFWIPIAEIFIGALFLKLMNKLRPYLHELSGVEIEKHENNKNLNSALLFVDRVI